MSWTGKKVLVTGADGFIGSHLVERLVREGAEVKAFVLYNSFSSWGWLDNVASDVKGKFEVFLGDIRDPNGVRVAMRGCDTVFHLAVDTSPLPKWCIHTRFAITRASSGFSRLVSQRANAKRRPVVGSV